MITKIGRRYEASISDDEADAMRRKHLIKGVLTPFVAGPVGTTAGLAAGAGLGGLVANLKGLPKDVESVGERFIEEGVPTKRQLLKGKGMLVGGALGTAVPIVLGTRHLLNYGATKEDLAREKARNSIIDW